MFAQNTQNNFTLKAYQGDAKTLLAFDLPRAKAKQLAGFTIAVQPEGQQAYYLLNKLSFDNPAIHTQNKVVSANSTLNSPIQKFRWLHVPGNFHQNGNPFFGNYTYIVTPRYFNGDNSLLPINNALSVEVKITVQPFTKGKTTIGFTRGFVQSQAFAHQFGVNALFKPPHYDLSFDTSAKAGINPNGQAYSFADEYAWSGYTARQIIFDLIDEIKKDPSLTIDVFAYDFNEPDIINDFLLLAKEKRIRIILDNASLHHNGAGTKPEDKFEQAFRAACGNQPDNFIKRGHFNRYQHNKVFIINKNSNPTKVLTGSTNFSVTGLYVNSNHLLVFDNAVVAQYYAQVFNEAWNDNLNNKIFSQSTIATQIYTVKQSGIPDMDISFSPHSDVFSLQRLNSISNRINAEKSSVFFAVMDTDPTVKGPIAQTLIDLHQKQTVFSYGITDSQTDIFLYKPDSGSGIKVTGLPKKVLLPPPFDIQKSITIGHQVHHKFIVCGFNTANAIVWCGSSNFAEGGENENGDNLIAIRDQDIATVFTIEALSLVDHFLFLDKYRIGTGYKNNKPPAMFLVGNDSWSQKYYDAKDMHYQDRILFR
ncbi:phospholipase D-like domain-containing protein [Arachidicoccus sp.]|uniref:phospholipase D-like domain-containing protein n=1 Tax=Arachidicoccus sp. TaxID=1872624 RepID=UPI003D25F183